MFLGVVKTIVGSLLCCGVGIVQCHFNLLYCAINPLSPNGDQHQFSPNNIHTLSRDKVMRIYEMINKEKML